MNNVKSIPNSLYYFMWINFLLYYTKLKYMWYTRTHAHRYTHKEMRSVINFVQGSSNEYTLILYYSTLKTKEKMGNPLWLYTNLKQMYSITESKLHEITHGAKQILCFIFKSSSVCICAIAGIQNNIIFLSKKLFHWYTCGLKECMLIAIIIYISLLVIQMSKSLTDLHRKWFDQILHRIIIDKDDYLTYLLSACDFYIAYIMIYQQQESIYYLDFS